MNATILLVGIASGAASAALTFAIAAGSFFSLFLSVFASLPILIAALGWRHHAGLVGSLAGTAFVFFVLGSGSAAIYALSVALPAWWLGYVALLGQPADPERPENGFVWYPVGRLLVWSASIGVALVLATVVFDGGSIDQYRASLRTGLTELVRVRLDAAQTADVARPDDGEIAQLIEMAVYALPPVIAASWTVVALINLWVAGRVVRASGRLARPWPDLSAFNLPALALMAFIGGLIGSFMPGLFGFAAGLIGAAFAVLFAALGLAFLHVATRGRPGRGFLLGMTYFLLSVLPWLGALLAALGVLEFLIGMRARIAAASLPPKPPLNLTN
jgi:Predicted membrane protein (DUF2232)